MAKDILTVCIQSEVDRGELYFKDEDEKLIKRLREKAAQEASKKYREEHMNHCFRCGTPSLVEIDRGDIKIDICVNEGCGAIHLDPGELEKILKNEQVIGNIKKSFLALFK
ncbi:MAG: zf-TFIIB domain-containing protein [Deltaproteobacteria bacterium]|nr:zf-TFIIB domain-containing protein [Deltaproteobacteria bacterium]